MDTVNGENFSVTVKDAKFSLVDLHPARNYSITVKAISNGIESTASTFYHAVTTQSKKEESGLIEI